MDRCFEFDRRRLMIEYNLSIKELETNQLLSKYQQLHGKLLTKPSLNIVTSLDATLTYT
jgi:hypothetical protein